MDCSSDGRQVDAQDLAELFQRMCDAWTVGDAQAYGACFTDDCDYVAFDGYRSTGRAAVIETHQKLFAGVLTGSALVGRVEAVRMLAEDVAMVHATGSVKVAWRKQAPGRRLTRSTITAVRTPDGWRAAAIHNARIRPKGIPELDSLPAKVARSLAHAHPR